MPEAETGKTLVSRSLTPDSVSELARTETLLQLIGSNGPSIQAHTRDSLQTRKWQGKLHLRKDIVVLNGIDG